MLDFRSLQMASASLSEALDAAKLRPADAFVRDVLIQRFEYTYELCVKSLRRQLEAMTDSPTDIDALGYRDMIRAGAEKGSSTTRRRGLVIVNCAISPAMFTTQPKRNVCSQNCQDFCWMRTHFSADSWRPTYDQRVEGN